MRSLFTVTGAWWRNWKAARANAERLERCGADEVRRIAGDVGVSASELRALAGKWPVAAESLDRRLAALGLDPAEMTRSAPRVMQDLQRVCSLCTETRECRHDLAARPSDPAWRGYCPNVATLDVLAAEREPAGKVN
jgi:hypothetical protein